MAVHEKLLEISPGPTELMPDGSKLDLPLDKVKSVSDGVNASRIVYLRMGENKQTWAISDREKKSENM